MSEGNRAARMARERERRRVKATLAGTRRWPIDELVEEFIFLKGTDHPHNLAKRFGMKPMSLRKRFDEHGYKDLARLL